MRKIQYKARVFLLFIAVSHRSGLDGSRGHVERGKSAAELGDRGVRKRDLWVLAFLEKKPVRGRETEKKRDSRCFFFFFFFSYA